MLQRPLYVAVLRPHLPYLVWAQFVGSRIVERGQHPKFDTHFTSVATVLKFDVRRADLKSEELVAYGLGARETLVAAVSLALHTARQDQQQAALMARNWAKAMAHGESRLEELRSTQLPLPGILPVE